MNLDMTSYFSRMTAIPDIGEVGLGSLQSAHVTVVGTGGVGSAAAWSLASLGLGHLSLIDQDIVEESNLVRLSGIDQDDLHKPKAEALSRKMSSRYPWTKVIPIVETLRGENCSELLGDSELLVDGTDNFQTRYVLNRFSATRKIPYLFTSAIANQGHLSLFTPPETPCLECAISDHESDPVQSCEVLGVTPSIVGLVGTLAASESAKWILDQPSNIVGQLLTLDLAGPDFIFTRISRRENCNGCGNNSSDQRIPRSVVMLCGGGVANVLPEKNKPLELLSLRDRIPDGQVISSSGSVLVFNRPPHRVSVFKTGRLLIGNVHTEDMAAQVARDVWNEMS